MRRSYRDHRHGTLDIPTFDLKDLESIQKGNASNANDTRKGSDEGAGEGLDSEDEVQYYLEAENGEKESPRAEHHHHHGQYPGKPREKTLNISHERPRDVEHESASGRYPSNAHRKIDPPPPRKSSESNLKVTQPQPAGIMNPDSRLRDLKVKLTRNLSSRMYAVRRFVDCIISHTNPVRTFQIVKDERDVYSLNNGDYLLRLKLTFNTKRNENDPFVKDYIAELKFRGRLFKYSEDKDSFEEIGFTTQCMAICLVASYRNNPLINISNLDPAS